MCVCVNVMHAGCFALAWAGEHAIYCFHMSDFPSSLLSYNRLCLCWGNLRGEGQKGTWKPSFESPFAPAASTLSLPFSPGSAGTVWPLPRLILGCFSELITLSPLLPLKSSVNYKNPPLLYISGGGWIMETVFQMKAEQDFQPGLIRGSGW